MGERERFVIVARRREVIIDRERGVVLVANDEEAQVGEAGRHVDGFITCNVFSGWAGSRVSRV